MRVLLAIARTGAVFPVPFPDNGEPGPATTRATEPRLQTAYARVEPARQSDVHQATTTLLIANINFEDQNDVLRTLAEQYAAQDSTARRAITAAVAVAVTTISPKFDPNSDAQARVWLLGLRILNDRHYFARAR
ncbi:hypothetical protein [Amycolatopsis sp. NPDC006125]|uniref:hypothetical protein n=1 Tax=Amycolatopsis sp. NPDC006125 TaxID=3156730 RepID=UPI0033B29011